MKKISYLLILLLAASVIFTGCRTDDPYIPYEPDPPPPPPPTEYIEVANPNALEQTVYADEEVATSTVEFTTLAPWESSIDVPPTTSATRSGTDWVSISPESGGVGNYEIEITLTPNTTGADRTVIITITSGDGTIEIRITQRYVVEGGTPLLPPDRQMIDGLVAAVYQILSFDCFAAGQWMPVNMFFDVLSDNNFAGGGGFADQPHLQQPAIFNASPSVSPTTGWWSIFFVGLHRANEALFAINNVHGSFTAYQPWLAERRAEVLTLRAWYMMWLWKAYGNIPFCDQPWDKPQPTGSGISHAPIARQHTKTEMVAIILADLDAAIDEAHFPDTRPRAGADRDRVHRAMAKMARARVLLHTHTNPGIDAAVRTEAAERLPQALADMRWVMALPPFALVTEGGVAFTGASITEHVDNPFEWIFLGAQPTTAGGSVAGGGEFSSESVFEVFADTSNGKNWGTPWNGTGNYTPTFISPRQQPFSPFSSGWGFMTVCPEAYAIFDEDDLRRTVSVINWGAKIHNYDWSNGFQNTGLWLGKYAARHGNNAGTGGDRLLNFANNRRLLRIAEAYLNAAELAYLTGGNPQPYLNAVRNRAFGGNAPPLAATKNNIRLEWRREFFGEGLRFWQLLRWNGDEHGRSLDAVLSRNNEFQQRTWTERSRLLPIPQTEIDRMAGTEFPLIQNQGY